MATTPHLTVDITDGNEELPPLMNRAPSSSSLLSIPTPTQKPPSPATSSFSSPPPTPFENSEMMSLTLSVPLSPGRLSEAATTTSSKVLRSRPYSSINFWGGTSPRRVITSSSTSRNHYNTRSSTKSCFSEKNSFHPEPFRLEPCTTGESIRQCLNNEFHNNFDVKQLTKVRTTAKNTRPTLRTIKTEHEAFFSQSARTRWNLTRDQITTNDVMSALQSFKK